MKCLFIYIDGREELHEQSATGRSEAGQPLPSPYAVRNKTFPARRHHFRVRTRTAYELLPVYKEIA